MNMYEDLAWHQLGFLLQDAFRSLFRSSSLHTLCFHGQIPPDFPIDLLASSCALKNLCVSHYHSSITYDVSDDAIRSLLPLRPDITAAAPQLESLEIMGKFASRLVKYLTHPLSPVQLSHLRELRVMKLEEENTTNTAWDVMQMAAKSLESLVWNDWSWHNSDPFKAVHLGAMQRLRFIELHGYTLRLRCRRLTNLLTSERMPTSIEKITLGFSTAWIHSRRLGIDEVEEIFMSSENQLDRTLAGLCDKAGFPCLRTIEVRVLLESVGESDTQARQSRLAKWFPALKETGYLSGGVFTTGE
ncbi:hypothetical protein FPV67DRAFT_830093 [Lyophyllum atratum]|nr:hypothetical protein FPV67DRAFT_830093 [Lyophyllum atratum]